MKFNCFFLLPFMDEFPAYLVRFLLLCACCSSTLQARRLVCALTFRV